MRRRRIAVLLVLVLAGGTLAAAHAASSGDAPRATRAAKWAKLSSDIAAVLEAQLANGRGVAVARSRGLSVRDGRVLVVVEARGTRAAATNAVQSVRGRVVAVHAQLVQAYVAPAALGSLSRSTAVAFLRAPRTPVITGPAIAVG